MKTTAVGTFKEMSKSNTFRKWTIVAALSILLAVAATARAQIPPTVTLTPAGINATNTDQNVTFTATLVSGDTPATYEWHWVDTNNVDWTLPQTGTNLTIRVVSPTDAGGYYVIVGNDAGSTYSTTNTLTVVTPPSMPVMQVNYSQNYGFDPLTTNGDFLLGLTDPLLPKPALTDGSATVGGVPNSGNSWAYGHGQTLTYALYGHYSISEMDTYAGCGDASNPNANTCNQRYTIAVSTDNGNTYSNVYTVVDALSPYYYLNAAPADTRVQLLPHNGGPYLVTNVDHIRFNFENDLVTPNVNDDFFEFMAYGTNTLAPGKPVITRDVPATVAATYSLAFSISVSALGNPIPSFQWYLISGGATNAIAGATNSIFTVSPAQLTNNGQQFEVVLTNSYGSVTSSVAKVVLYGATSTTNIIYQDDFARTGPLFGSMPTPVNTGNAQWTSYSGDNFGTNYFATDGTQATNTVAAPHSVKNSSGGSINQFPNIFLPFTPQWGHIYTLSCDMTSVNGTGSWEALGFAQYDCDTNYFAGAQVGSAGWALIYANGISYQGFLGPGTGNRKFNYLVNWPVGQFTHFSCVLNTTTGNRNANTGWTCSFYTNDVQVTNGTVASWTYANNPTINYVGFGEDGTLAQFQHFKLTDVAYQAVPVQLTATNVSNQLTIKWPNAYQGWLLQSNSVGLQSTNAWVTIPGSDATNQMPITVNPGQHKVFYRLVSP